MDTIWTQPPARKSSILTFFIVLYKFCIIKVLQILHCNNYWKSFVIPFNEYNCTIQHVIFKSFCNVGLMMVFFGLKHVVILEYNLVALLLNRIFKNFYSSITH